MRCTPRRVLEEANALGIGPMGMGGVTTLLGVKAVGVSHDAAGRVTTLQLDDGQEVSCTELIVADGARSTLGRVLGRVPEWDQEWVPSC